MDELLYEACLRYFTTLSKNGYRNYEDVKRLIFYIFIEELVNTTSIVISEDDYTQIEKALYCIYGTSCLISYPDYCGRPMDGYFGDIAELSARVARTEDELDVLNSQNLDERLTATETTVGALNDLDFVLEGEVQSNP